MAVPVKKVAVVTGANQGLGFALVRNLCKTLGESTDVYLTARNEQRGTNAVQILKDEGLNPKFHLLDIDDVASIQTLATFLKENYGGVDYFISNAGARIDKETPQSEQIEAFIKTNNHGTYHIIKHISPLFREGTRFVVVASGFGTLVGADERLRPFFDIEKLTLENVEENLDRYACLYKEGKTQDEGWPERINRPSRIGQVASLKILARDIKEQAREKDVIVNAACPGLIDTAASWPWFDDMSNAKSPDDASDDVVYLVTLPKGTQEPYGELLQYRKVIGWTKKE